MEERANRSRGEERESRSGVDWKKLARPQVWLVALFFAFPAAGAVLSFLTTYVDGQGGVTDGLEGASSSAVSPDGRHVYAAGALDDSLVVFARDATNHVLTFVEVLRDQVGGVFGLNGASGVDVSADGRHVYVSSHGDDAVAVFARDATSDLLSFVETQEDGVGGVDGLDGASSIRVSPDDRFVYATGRNDSSLAVFARDASTDDLSFVTSASRGGTFIGLLGASDVATTPDGRFVYVAGREDDAVAVFEQLANGTLDYLGAVEDGVDGANGLAGASALAVSPDGLHLYVAARMEDAVGVFSIPPSGIPEFIERKRDGVAGVFGLNEPTAVAVSADGSLVLATGKLSQAVVLFRRDPGSGSLSFVETAANGAGGVTGLAGASSALFTADGREIYVTGREDDALVILPERPAVHGRFRDRRSLRLDHHGPVGASPTALVAPRESRGAPPGGPRGRGASALPNLPGTGAVRGRTAAMTTAEHPLARLGQRRDLR